MRLFTPGHFVVCALGVILVISAYSIKKPTYFIAHATIVKTIKNTRWETCTVQMIQAKDQKQAIIIFDSYLKYRFYDQGYTPGSKSKYGIEKFDLYVDVITIVNSKQQALRRIWLNK